MLTIVLKLSTGKHIRLDFNALPTYKVTQKRAHEELIAMGLCGPETPLDHIGIVIGSDVTLEPGCNEPATRLESDEAYLVIDPNRPKLQRSTLREIETIASDGRMIVGLTSGGILAFVTLMICGALTIGPAIAIGYALIVFSLSSTLIWGVLSACARSHMSSDAPPSPYRPTTTKFGGIPLAGYSPTADPTPILGEEEQKKKAAIPPADSARPEGASQKLRP